MPMTTARKANPEKPQAAKKASEKKVTARRVVAKTVAAQNKEDSTAKIPPKKNSSKKAPAKKSAPAKKVSPPMAEVPAVGLLSPGPFADLSLPWWADSVVMMAAHAANSAKAKAKGPGKARKKLVKAGTLGIETCGNLTNLLERAREECFSKEQQLADDIVIVQADMGLAADSAELQTLSSLHLGQLVNLMASDEPGPTPEVEVLRTRGTMMAMRVNETAIRVVRRSSPGLRVYAESYLYPQNVRPLGVQLSSQSLTVAEGTAATAFQVLVQDSAGHPIEGVAATAVLNWLGTNVRDRTDARGIATLRIPTTFPAVGSILVEPDHTYWSRAADGFQMSSAPEVVQFELERLLPDPFGLMAKYAPVDEEAGKGVRVGVIDSGVGPHADLTVAGGGCFITNEDRNDFQDNGLGHGTHVAGIIAAKKSSGGICGLAPGCTLLSYRVFPRAGATDKAASLDVAAALEQAIADKCDLVNLSLGSLQAMPELPAVLEDARNAGVVVLAATGNDGRQLLRYPARYSHTLGIGALGRDATFPNSSPLKQPGLAHAKDEFVARFSNHGVGTDFIGVGVAVLSTYPGDRYAMMSGTSMATPFTTGMAARLLAQSPALLNMARSAARTDAIVDMLTKAVRRLDWPDMFSGFGVLK